MSAAARLASTLPAPPDSGEYPIPSMRSVRRWVDECPACEGDGKTKDVDYDDGDTRLVVVECEACDGSGLLANCIACDEIMSAPEADRRGYRCAACSREDT